MNRMNIKYKFPKMNIDQQKYENYMKDFKTKDLQLAEIPKEIKFCKKCVGINQRPRTEFNEEGICNACVYAQWKFFGKIDWEKREKELRELCDKHRSKDGSFDCIVPGSAGKDSALVTHQLKHKYGMHPLAVTWAPFIYSAAGFQNYFNMIHSGFDGIISWPNGILHRKLARVAFELVGDPWQPFTYGQKALAWQMAWKFKIPLIFYGENGEVEYGGSFKNADKAYEEPNDWDELYMKGAGVDVLLQEGLKMGIFTEEELKSSQFEMYRAPPLEEIRKLGLQMHWFGYYKLWVPQEHFYYAAKNTGFEANVERTPGTFTKFVSLDDRLDPFHWITGYMKFGYGRAAREACTDIRCGHITREEGVALVQRYDHEFPEDMFREFLEYLDITEDHFWELMERYRRPNVWEKVEGKWRLRRIVSNKDIVHGEIPSPRIQFPQRGVHSKALHEQEKLL